MKTFPKFVHHIPTEGGVITVVEQPIERVYGDPYPNAYRPSLNVFWKVRYTLSEPDGDKGLWSCTLVVPCATGWQSAPPDNTLSMLMEDGENTVNSTPKEDAEGSGADFTEEQWKEIHAVWRGWLVALGEFFGPYYNSAREFFES